MSQTNHKNLLSYFVSFVDDTDIWLVMPLVNGGSIEKILDNHFVNGIKDEKILANVLK